MILSDHFGGGVQHVLGRAGVELGFLASHKRDQRAQQN